MIDFYYSRGIVKTIIPWTRPTQEQATNYFLYLKNNSTILDRYDLYIHGRFMYVRTNTWDLDIQLIGNYQLEQLEQDLNYMLDVALNKFRLLVDVKCLGELVEPLTYENTVNTNYIPKIVPAIQIMNVTKIRKDITEILVTPFVIEKQLSKNMIMVKYDQRKPKLLDLTRSDLKDLKLIMHVTDFLNTTSCECVATSEQGVSYH